MHVVAWTCFSILLLSNIGFNLLIDFPYWLDRLTSSLICAGALWIAWREFRMRQLTAWVIALVMIAGYFNPFYRIQVADKQMNLIIVLLSALIFAAFGYHRSK